MTYRRFGSPIATLCWYFSWDGFCFFSRPPTGWILRVVFFCHRHQQHKLILHTQVVRLNVPAIRTYARPRSIRTKGFACGRVHRGSGMYDRASRLVSFVRSQFRLSHRRQPAQIVRPPLLWSFQCLVEPLLAEPHLYQWFHCRRRRRSRRTA